MAVDQNKVIARINQIEAHLDLLKKHLAALKQELLDNNTSGSSARKGGLPEKEKARVLAKLQRSRMKKPLR